MSLVQQFYYLQRLCTGKVHQIVRVNQASLHVLVQYEALNRIVSVVCQVLLQVHLCQRQNLRKCILKDLHVVIDQRLLRCEARLF